MTSKELRQEFLNFFEKRGHKIVPSSSLIPTDPSVLFTSAGMQQFKEYFLGKESPYGDKVCSCQKCFRTSDIEEVGNDRHLTFLEMLGNFSFGSYFKQEAIKLAYDFILKELKLPEDDITITVFEGDKAVPFDKESSLFWKKLGIPEKRIRRCSRSDNFWGPTGNEGPCGPTTEIYFKETEIWNIVFNEYFQDKKGKLSLLKQKGVDTGMGLERLAVAVQGKNNIYETDLFEPLVGNLDLQVSLKAGRIITDHLKGSVFLISEGILPSNLDKGYILRRVLRRSIRYARVLNLSSGWYVSIVKKVIELYQDEYPEVKRKETDILTIIQNEKEKFEKTLEKGLSQFEKLVGSKQDKKLKGNEVFDLYQSYGFPLELTKELAEERGLEVDEKGFYRAQEKHQNISRAGKEKKFGGLGKEADYEMTKLHTATHLLHAALRQVLGEHVKQMGSDITSERLRFDFSHSQKMSPEEIEKVESLVNQKIKQDLGVKKEEVGYQEALESGALAFFKEKYPEKVTVYSVDSFSKEICAGPHIEKTSELGQFKIIKQESSGAGVRRIKAILKKHD